MFPIRPSQARRPAVAGTFYPARPELLREAVERFLVQATPPALGGRVRALIAPHAGYLYSGPVAGSAYAVLAGVSPPPRRVALLGPSHFVPLAGLALPESDQLETPLGAVPVDPLAETLSGRLAQVIRSERAHAQEHSLEVQLPFLQCVLADGFTVLPLAVGQASPSEVAETIDVVWELPETLVVVSTDLSHHLPAEQARAVDARTSRLVVAEDVKGLDADMACGHQPLAGLLLAARRRGWSVVLLDLRNSADTAGDPDRVVGYGAFAVVDLREARA